MGFHVSMCDSITVNITQGPYQLLCYFSNLLEIERVIILDDIEELSLSELGDQDEL